MSAPISLEVTQFPSVMLRDTQKCSSSVLAATSNRPRRSVLRSSRPPSILSS